MKGDFSRNTFDPQKRYSRVLMQQGRVQVDADWNEQLDITGYRVGTEAVDVIGQTGAPKHAAAFGIVLDPTTLTPAEQARATALELTPLGAGDLLLTPGRFYTGGTQCEVEDFLSLTKQPDFPGAAAISEAGSFLIYLDVWQRHLTALDDDGIREKALGGPDTATRTKTIWQVKTAKMDAPKCISDAADWAKIVKLSTGQLMARAEPGEDTDKPCVLPPGAGYRRLENQLYRVEMHQPGALGTATFKWSRDNGIVVTRLAGPVNGKELKVEDLGRDEVLGFNPGDWVELLDDANELNGTPGVLAQIDTVERAARKVVFKDAPSGFTYVKEQNPKMRRWDDASGERKVKTGAAADDGFLELEDGVQVKFADGYYNTGDYWLIPARTAPNGIEWPTDPATKKPLAQAPQGVAHSYACLGWVTATGSGEAITLSDPHDCRDIFPPLTEIEDDEEARKRHNRLLHGWGVVCGLQVHCGGDRQNVHIEPGYALECDGSEVLLPPPGRNFAVVAAAREADLLKNGAGHVALTMALDTNKQINFGVRKLEGEGATVLQSILKGTLLKDVYHDCLDPLIQFARKELFVNDSADKRLVNETVRRRTAALNLAVQFVNQSIGSHVLLSAKEHAYLEKIYDDLKKFLNDPVYCGLLDGLEKFPDYPFKEQGALTAFGKAPMTEVRVAPDGRVAYAFGGTGDAKVYVFDLAKPEMAAEIELKAVPGASTLTVRDVAFFAKGTAIMVAATSATDSVLYSYKVPKLGGTYELLDEPVVVEDKFLVKLGQISQADNFMYGIAQGEGLVRFSPEKFGAGSFRASVPFNASGHWLVGTGAGAGFIYAGAADGTNRTDRYTKVLVVSVRGDQPELAQTFELKAGGNDGFSVLLGTTKAGSATNRAIAASRLYVAVEPATGTTAKRLFVFGGGGDQIATIVLPTDGPVNLAPTAKHDFMMVTLAEQYLLGWIDPAKNAWTAELTLPTQMYPTAVTTAAVRTPFVVVVNRDSHTLGVLPAELVSSKPTLTVPDMVKYRAELIALFRMLGLSLLQSLKDCFCEHLRVNCPVCTEKDVIELAAVDIREGRVYHICNSRRREVLTFPKVSYWLSLVPVIPALSYLVREFCCLVLPDVFKPATGEGKDVITAASVLKVREQLTLTRFSAIKKEAFARFGQMGGLVLNTTKNQAIAPLQKQSVLQSNQLVKEDAEVAKRRLADSGVEVAEVADYDSAVEKGGWSKVSQMQFSYQPGDRVTLYTRNGRVVMVTRATETAASATPEVEKEISRLNGELTQMQETHAAYITAREKEMADMKANLEKFKVLLRSPAAPTRALAAGRPKTKKPKG